MLRTHVGTNALLFRRRQNIFSFDLRRVSKEYTIEHAGSVRGGHTFTGVSAAIICKSVYLQARRWPRPAHTVCIVQICLAFSAPHKSCRQLA